MDREAKSSGGRPPICKAADWESEGPEEKSKEEAPGVQHSSIGPEQAQLLDDDEAPEQIGNWAMYNSVLSHSPPPPRLHTRYHVLVPNPAG
ncbi:hypothetical protein ColTof4_03327 [Colletotrichum tofieldiae]|nr:hypothetical protein ColTof3_13257 [Colletotrichum tofieldiae]GKT70904.1 hypothetical protein ColTof4_03327 [Colletotrichum tofieldiae]GKT94195.1 hypothetical protein Ct61P_12045 [Colletotrichum tofieldiae]